MDVDDVDVVPCHFCHENIDLSDAARRRRTAVPSWVRCSFCMDVYHSTCANIPSKCTRIGFYEWQCNECKVCQICQKDDEDGMLFCDGCDRGYHGKCLNPPVNVSAGDETPFLCKDCIEAKHTTRGFRRTKILGCDTKRQLLLKKDSPKKKPKNKPPRKIRQRRSESLEAENDSSSVDEADAHVSDALPKTCVARGCDGSGHLNGVSESHDSLVTCPIYNRLDKRTSLLYTETMDALENVSIKRTKDCKEMIDRLSTLADVRMNPPKKPEKLTKPTDVLLAPELKGVSSFSKTLFEMSKVQHASKLEGQNTASHNKRNFFVEKISIGNHVVNVHEMSATIRDEPLHAEVYFCDTCLDISHEKLQYSRHTAACNYECPGEKIYSKDDLAVFEIDGRLQKTFCQNLSLLSRFFLATKAVCYDVIYMMYYVLVQRGADGRCRPVGYFSKDKDLEKNTLACILVLPQYENQGFGKLLIDLSYVIARTTRKPGTPERPLSRAGLLAFSSYWQCMVSRALLSYWDGTEQMQYPALLDLLIEHLGMAKDDIEDTLVRLDLIKTDPKTKKLMLIKGSTKEMLQEHAQKREILRNLGRLVDLSCLRKDWLKKLPARKLV